MIIFGWGHTTIENCGVVFNDRCSHCNNHEPWSLMRIQVWFTLFFIPIFPYKDEYRLICPICERGYVIKSDKVGFIKTLAKNYSLLLEKKITLEEFQLRIAEKSSV